MRNLLVIFLFLLTGSVSIARADQGSFKVGAILPLTGDLASIGSEIQKGMELGKHSLSQANFQIVYEDDQSFDNLVALKAAQRLIHQERVSIIFSAGVNITKAISSLARQSGVPVIVIWDNNRNITNLGKDFYSIGFSTEMAGADMAKFAFSNLGAKQGAILGFEDEWSKTIASAFTDKYRNLGGKVTKEESVTGQDQDFRAILTKIKATNPDFIYLPLNPPLISTAIRQARELQVAKYILTADGFGDSDIQNLGTLAEGVYATQLWLADEKFLQQYRKQNGTDSSPTNLAFSGLGYDAISLVKQLARTNRLNDGSKRAVAPLLGLSFEGVTGKTTISHEEVSQKREPILVVEAGKFKLVQKN